jgi:hypothetical protein
VYSVEVTNQCTGFQSYTNIQWKANQNYCSFYHFHYVNNGTCVQIVYDKLLPRSYLLIVFDVCNLQVETAALNKPVQCSCIYKQSVNYTSVLYIYLSIIKSWWTEKNRCYTTSGTKLTTIVWGPYSNVKIKILADQKQSQYRPGQALSFPEGWSSQISRQSVLESSKVVRRTHRPPLPSRIYSWYSFLLEAESNLGP